MSEKIRSIHINKLEQVRDFEMYEKLLQCRVIFITERKRVVAHAKWNKEGDLVIAKIRRESKKKLEVGQVLYESYKPQEIPPCPELHTEGWQLFRSSEYDSSKALRKDPYWDTHEGWFVIPNTINDQDALTLLKRDYPEVKHLEVKQSSEVDVSKLKMAPYSEIDRYVTAQNEISPPELQPFQEPTQKDMVQYTPAVCYCGCGRFEGWNLYWTNRWVVYVPRNASEETA